VQAQLHHVRALASCIMITGTKIVCGAWSLTNGQHETSAGILILAWCLYMLCECSMREMRGTGAASLHCETTIDRAGMAALRLRCIANSALNKKSNLQNVGTLVITHPSCYPLNSVPRPAATAPA
jgi:hypothetical protein